MKIYTKEELTEIIRLHKMWLNDEDGGIKANISHSNLRGSDLRGSNLSGSNLSGSNLSGSDLSGSNLSGSDLSGSDLSGSDLSGSNLRGSNLSGSDLSGSNLRGSNLRGSNLSGSNLRGSDLRYSNLSGVVGLINAAYWMADNFEKTAEGYIVYKSFGDRYNAPEDWKIEPGSVINEVVNQLPTLDCACGINFATLEWVKRNTSNDIWKCLIRWEWLPLVTVPYNTDGKARCGRLELIEIIER